MMNQQQMQMSNGMQQPGQQQQQPMNLEQHKREQALANFPAPLQAILRSKPQSEWRNVLQQFQNSGNMRRSLSQQPQGVQPQQPQQQQPHQVPQLQNGAFLGGANIGAMPMMQSLSQGAVSQQGDMNIMQAQMQQNQEMMRQRQMAMQQQKQQQQQQQQPPPPQQQPQNQGQQQVPRQQLNSQQMKIMDQQAVPSSVFNTIRQNAPLPEVKTWYQLKQWLIQNPVPNWPVSHILDIQATHFLYIMKGRSQQQQNNAVPQGQPSQQMPQPQMQGAPAQPPVPPNSMRVPNQIDVQKVRTANPKLANATDDQIRTMILQRQRQQMQKAMQQQQQQQQAAAQGMGQPMQFSSSQQGQQFAMQAPQSQQAQQQPHPASAQAGAQPRPSPTQPDNKPVKRPSDDDVIEMPNPNLNKQPQPQMEGKLPQLTKEQFNALDPAKKQQYLNMQREQQLRRRLHELMKEVQSSMPKLRPIPNMDPASKERLTSMLTSENVKNMVGRFDAFLIACYRMDQNEANLKQLTMQKIQLLSQYKPEALQRKAFEVVDNFSISPETAETIIGNIMAKFHQTVATIPQNKTRQQPAQLTPENLNLLQAQEAERKKSLKSNQVPPAPTSTQPPFQLGDKGQGAPTWYGNQGLKQEDLKLPANNKRQKKNQQQATPAAGTPPVVTSPQQLKAPKPTESFKCPVQGCEHQLKGFATQVELDQHHNVAHKLDMEPVTDPLAFLKDSLRSALNLDENLKQIKKPKAETKSKIKDESAAATPMTKIPSQAGTKTGDTKIEDDDPWQHTNITLDQLRVAFGGDEWDELFPTQEKHLEQQSRFYESYRNSSERWRKITEGAHGALTDTSTEKSKSPEFASDKELPAAKGQNAELEKKEDDAWVVNLQGIEGLDLSGLDELSPFENIGDNDVTMGESGSPFETIEKPALSTEEMFLRQHGLDMAHPEDWTVPQRELADFVMQKKL